MAAAVLMLAPAALLGVLGFTQLRDGLANDAAIPVPAYMVAQIPLPKAAYRSAAAALADADVRNGNAQIARAEALLRAGEPKVHIAGALQGALGRSPVSARGWVLLSETLYSTEKRNAARAVSQALVLAPREYWLIGARGRDAAYLWSDLDKDSQSLALAQARLMWQEPLLHEQLLALFQTPEGAALVSRAFGQEEIRTINRWRSRELRRRRSP